MTTQDQDIPFVPQSRQSHQPLQPQEQQQQQQSGPADRPHSLGQHKLRQSCDACANAKVRCGKERPRCERCIESNLTCVYGLSMKHGKGSQKRRHQALQPPAKSLSPPFTSSERGYQDELRQSLSDLLQNISDTTNLSPNPSWLSSNDVVMTGTTHPTTTSTNSLAFDDPLSMDGMATVPAEACGNESFDQTLSMISGMDFSQILPYDLSDSTKTPSSSTSPPAGDGNIHSLPPLASPESPGTHNCHVIASSTLAILHSQSRPFAKNHISHIASTYSDMGSTYGPMQALQNLDDVLRCTRDAMGNMYRLLSCSCASDPHMAMLEASIIMRILSWHQLAAKVEGGTSMPLSSLDEPFFMDLFAPPRTPTTKSQQSSCSTPTPSISSEPVRIGSFVPDHEHQKPMLQLYLLMNLKKLAQLVDVFAQVRDSVDAKPTQLHVTLASWLDTELSRTIKEVGQGARSPI